MDVFKKQIQNRTCGAHATWKADIRRIVVQDQPELSQKYPTQKRADGVAQVVASMRF
jgi:hypothetical protein